MIRKPLRFFLLAIAALLLLLVLGGLMLYQATRYVPDFYQQALEVNPQQQAAAGDELERQVLELHNEIQDAGRWQAVFDEDQINGWLASDLKEKFSDSLPAGVSAPRVAIAPLLFIWLGFGALPKIVLAATICFFPVLINSLTGLTLVDEEADQLFRSLGATRSQRFFRLALPGALPVIFAGLKTSISLALIGAIVGEFVSAQEGLGLLIQRFSFQLNTSAAYAVLLTLTVIGLVLYGLMELADRWIVYWNRDDRLHHRTEHAASKHAAALIRISKNQ